MGSGGDCLGPIQSGTETAEASARRGSTDAQGRMRLSNRRTDRTGFSATMMLWSRRPYLP